MWPWEHLAVGYLAYAVARRLVSGRHPAESAALAVAVATQLPDLIDKPLAWVFDVLPSGTSLGHSVLFATPLSLLVAAVAIRRGRPDVGVAFGVGYATHLVGDVVYPALVGDSLSPAKVLWPVVPAGAGGSPGRVLDLVAAFATFLATPRGQYYVVGELLLVGLAAAWWLYDGVPGLGAVRRSVTGR